MAPGQAASGRYQLLMGPWYHLNSGSGLDLDRIELAWFDTWLKDARTGMAETKNPLHVYDLGAGRWVDTARYPFDAQPRRPSTSARAAASPAARRQPRPGADPIAFTAVSNPCSASSDQWSAGGWPPPSPPAAGRARAPPAPR